MSIAMVRGGIPQVRRETVDATGRGYKFKFQIMYLIVRTDAPVKLYFTEADFTVNENYILVPAPAAATPYGEWQGPVELYPNPPATAHSIWLKGVANVEMVGFQRRA